MAADIHSKGVTWDTPNGNLAPVEHLRNNRSESPTPGLVEGTEPGEAGRALCIFSGICLDLVIDGDAMKTWTGFSGLAFISFVCVFVCSSGAGQERAMFVHTQSFEDLTADVDLTGSRRSNTDEVEEKEEEQQQGGGEAGPVDELKQDVQALVREKEEDVTSEMWRSHKKHVFVLSEAGKPIYTRYGSEEALSTTMGVMMALVSFVEANKNVILSIHAGHRHVSLLNGVLIRRVKHAALILMLTQTVWYGASRALPICRDLTTGNKETFFFSSDLCILNTLELLVSF